MRKLRVLLGLLLLVLMLSSCDNNYNDNKTVGNGMRADIANMQANTVYVFTTYMTSQGASWSFEMYTYPDAKVTQYDWYFVVEYEKDGSVCKETFSNSAFGYYYKECEQI